MTRMTRAMGPVSLLLSILALVVATSMTSAYAATALKNKSVTTKKIKNNAVTAKKIKNNAVTAPKIRAGAVTYDKLSADAINRLKGAQGDAGPQGVQGEPGPQGPQGVQGDVGPQGVQGAAGVSGYEVVDRPGNVTIPSGQTMAVNTTCPAGKKAIGGGALMDTGSSSAPVVQGASPVNSNTGWSVRVHNSGTGSISMSGTAICITAN